MAELSKVSLVNCSFTNISVVSGIIYVTDQTNITIRDSEFEQNKALSCGVIYAQTLSNVELSNNSYLGNYADSAAVICGLYISLLRDTDSQYSSNSAKYSLSVGNCNYCSSIYYVNISLVDNEVLITNEQYSRGYLYDISNSNFNFLKVIFQNNRGNDSQRNLYISSSKGIFNQCQFADTINPNFTQSIGGYAFVYESDIEIEGCLFSQCYAFQGGCMYSYNSVLNIQNCTYITDYRR